MGIIVTSNDTLIGEGRTVTFNAEARGIGTLRYKWRKRGSNSLSDKVLGSDTLNLTIPNIESSDEGDYYCVATNMWDISIESNSVTLNVYGMLVYVQICFNCDETIIVGRPIVTIHPESRLVTSNMSITLDCDGSDSRTGNNPIEYRWENSNINGGNWITIDNSDSKKLVVKNLEQSEQYRCVVSNDVGDTTSNVAVITVLSKCMV